MSETSRNQKTSGRQTASGSSFWQNPYALLIVAIVVVAGVGSGLYAYFADGSHRSDGTAAAAEFDGEQAYVYLKEICDIGPRRSGSDGMKEQQEYITKYFNSLDLEVKRQEFTERHPQTGEPVELANLIVELHPDKKDRVLICCHYDTRPFPNEDDRNPLGTFIGANDGASGVALLMQLAKELQGVETGYGIDLIMFDGEELVFRSSDRYFLGSEYFANTYAKDPPEHKYHYGILVDMIGDADLQIYQERNSLAYRDTAPLVRSIWRTARELRVHEFINRPMYEIRDDHLALNNIAAIPTCDLIDFDYPYWHTEGDIASRCSAESLAKVGYVLKTWLQRAKPGQALPGNR